MMLNTPNLPTDNLYKFMAVTGAVAVLSAIFFMTSMINDTYEKVFDLSKKLSLLEIRTQSSVSEFENFKKAISKLEVDDSVMSKHEPSQTHQYAEVIKFLDEHMENSIFLESDIAKLKADRERIVHYSNQIDRYIIWLSVIVMIGSALSCLGFWLWYMRVQKSLDALIKRQIEDVTIHGFSRKYGKRNNQRLSR